MQSSEAISAAINPNDDSQHCLIHKDYFYPPRNTDMIEIVKRPDIHTLNTGQIETSSRSVCLPPITNQQETSSRCNCLTPNIDQLDAGDMELNTNANGARTQPKTRKTSNLLSPTPRADKSPAYAPTQYPNFPPGQYLYIPPNTYNPNPTYYRYPGNETPVDLAPQIPTEIATDDRLGCPYDTMSSLSPEALIVLCILVSIFFFLPTGLAAVIFAFMALIARNGGNMPQAKFYSLLAQRLVVISVVITVFLMALLVLIMIVMFIVFAGSVHHSNRTQHSPLDVYKHAD